MNDKQTRLVTAEAVRRGHPDKLCDQIADAILDAHLSCDPNARVAVEVMATAGTIIVAGEVTSRADVNYEETVLGVLQQIGYKWADLCERDDDLTIEVAIHDQPAAVGGHNHKDHRPGARDQQGHRQARRFEESGARIHQRNAESGRASDFGAAVSVLQDVGRNRRGDGIWRVECLSAARACPDQLRSSRRSFWQRLE